jgi:hypothetical protein
MSDQAIINMLGILVQIRLTGMAGPKRAELEAAWATVKSAVETRSTVAAEVFGEVKGRTAITRLDETITARITDPVENRQNAWDDAEATGLGWPGYYTTHRERSKN